MLLPSPHTSVLSSALLLAARIIFGLLFLSHGMLKWMAFSDLVINFPDPLGVGHTVSLLLTIFAEVLCSVAFIMGFLYRLALLPMIFAMAVAAFVIHAGDPLVVREPALIYLTIFIIMFISGAGRFSVDAMIQRYLQRG